MHVISRAFSRLCRSDGGNNPSTTQAAQSSAAGHSVRRSVAVIIAKHSHGSPPVLDAPFVSAPVLV
jgi:hypothetical protein